MNEGWHDGDGEPVTFEKISEHIADYLSRGGNVFVGTDSQIKTTCCLYVTAICLHGTGGNPPGLYFFKKLKEDKHSSKLLKTRIMQEVQYSIDIGTKLMEEYPLADIEVHIDVGSTPRSATRIYVDIIRGWLAGIGFKCKMKPNAWASSSVADWHTKS